jgi:hypothetical protein
MVIKLTNPVFGGLHRHKLPKNLGGHNCLFATRNLKKGFGAIATSIKNSLTLPEVLILLQNLRCEIPRISILKVKKRH